MGNCFLISWEVLGLEKGEFPSLRGGNSVQDGSFPLLGDRLGKSSCTSCPDSWLLRGVCSAGEKSEGALKSASKSPFPCTFAIPTPQGGSWGALGVGPQRCLASRDPQLWPMGLQLLWTLFMEGMCLQLQIPTEKDKGNRWGEIPGPHFSCCSCGLQPLNLARLPREGFYKAHCLFLESHPHPFPHLLFLPFFLSSPAPRRNAAWERAGGWPAGCEGFCPQPGARTAAAVPPAGRLSPQAFPGIRC